MQAMCRLSVVTAALAVFSLTAVSWTARAEEAVSKPAGDSAVKIGQKVADFTFKDIRYLPRQLADFGEKKAFVIVFTTLDCPLAQRVPAAPQGDG